MSAELDYDVIIRTEREYLAPELAYILVVMEAQNTGKMRWTNLNDICDVLHKLPKTAWVFLTAGEEPDTLELNAL